MGKMLTAAVVLGLLALSLTAPTAAPVEPAASPVVPAVEGPPPGVEVDALAALNRAADNLEAVAAKLEP
jgi:hypothetical protein